VAVAQCIAGRENYVADALEERDFAVMNLRCRQRLKSVTRILSLFPGYVFVWIVDHFWTARRSPGVIDLVMDGLRPARLPQSEVERITATLDTKTGLIELPKKGRCTTEMELERGTSVRILWGNFRGLNGLFEEISPRECVIVLLDMLGRRQVRVELAPDDQVTAIG
jgi:transcription antitermination factor NusG